MTMTIYISGLRTVSKDLESDQEELERELEELEIGGRIETI